jgi:DNA-binding CsgD family transcriptional regulator
VKTSPAITKPTHIPIPEANPFLVKKKAAPPKSGTGFLMLDCSLTVLSFNAEAALILGYPDNAAKLANSRDLLTQEIRSKLVNWPYPGESVFVTEFRSGARRYFCRAFLVDSSAQASGRPSIVILLERGPSGLIALSQVSEQFNFTQREHEVLEYLLQGMGSKDIAKRMNVSPNTVKAFLRLIMIKMGVSSRSAIVGKIVMLQR